MDERLRFVAQRLDGEPIAALCREFGIARKTGYKIFDRYKSYGLRGLSDRSRRPQRCDKRRASESADSGLNNLAVASIPGREGRINDY